MDTKVNMDNRNDMSNTENKKEAKKKAKEDIRELAGEIKTEKKARKAQRRQRRIEERRKYPTGIQRRRAQSLRWKKEKADRRNALIDNYQDAPWPLRVCRLYLLKPFVAILIIAAIVGGIIAFGQEPLGDLFSDVYDGVKNAPASQEEIHALSPVDEKGAERIDAVAPVGSDDMWTISIYIVGADLEDWHENDLSQVVQTQVESVRKQIETRSEEGYKKRLNSFSDELKKKDLEIPAYLYYPNKPVKSEEKKQEEPVIAKNPGAASKDINEITSDTWSDNIRVLIQTGGATRWSNDLVNPNRTQRFLYYKGEFSELEDLPLQSASDPKTLTSFLNFSKKNYPADHNMLILWNHGAGAFGYGADSIYGGKMSLKDIRKALSDAYEPNGQKPPFDIIGFDACLMSSLEVTHALNGFASYYAVSEESEPGEGWDYASWLKAMTKDPTMSPAKVAQTVADTYTDFYMTQNVNVGWLFSSDVTFSVLDASKTEELYKAWCDLTKKQLIDAATDSSVLSEIGRCSNKSTHYVSTAYNVINTIDMGNYVDVMVDTYPEECSRIKKLIGESVMYHRENGSLSESQGISVYVPGSVDTYQGLAYCLDYIYNICEDPSTQALYYYKIAGCLNEDMEKYLETLTDRKPQSLDLKPFRQFAKAKPVITDDGFDIQIDDKLLSMVGNYSLETALYDEETDTTVNYGRDETARMDGEGNVNCQFDGTWICYDGVPLATEVVSSTDSLVEYRSNVLYNGNESVLSFTWDREKEEFTVNGVKGVSELSGIYNEDPFNYLINTRMNTKVKKGDVITPIYEVSGGDRASDDKEEDVSHGKKVKISKGSKISIDKLPSGYYLTSAVISDQRGDVYYSRVVGNKVSGGKVKNRKADTDFVGRDY